MTIVQKKQITIIVDIIDLLFAFLATYKRTRHKATILPSLCLFSSVILVVHSDVHLVLFRSQYVTDSSDIRKPWEIYLGCMDNGFIISGFVCITVTNIDRDLYLFSADI